MAAPKPAGASSEPSSNHLFTDVSENMIGCGNNTFSPDENLSRTMLAQIFYNKEERPAASGNIFIDAPSDA